MHFCKINLRFAKIVALLHSKPRLIIINAISRVYQSKIAFIIIKNKILCVSVLPVFLEVNLSLYIYTGIQRYVWREENSEVKKKSGMRTQDHPYGSRML